MSDHTTTDLTAPRSATGTLTIRNMDDLARIGKMLAQSGYFADAREAAQAGVKVLAGLEMGIGAFSAMSGIHIIKGKPSVGAGLMASAVKRSGKYDYRVRRHDAAGCEIEFFQAGESIGTSAFGKADAEAAGLLSNDNYKRNPRNMYFARALSNGVRWYCPDVFTTSTYTPEELGAEMDDEGNVITVSARASASPREPRSEERPPFEPDEPDASGDGEFPPDPPGTLFDGDAKPDTISASAATRLHAKLGKVGVPKDEHLPLASAAVGRDVTGLSTLSKVEAVRVSEVADALNDGRAIFRDGAIESTEPPDDEEDQIQEGDAA